MKKKPKTQANKAGLPSLAQLKKEVSKNMLHTAKHLFTFTPEHFNEHMSSPAGFGAQDLQPRYLELYTHLLTKYKGKLVAELDSYKVVSLYAKH